MTRLPEHVAIIMDGNGRWARAKSRPRVYGHLRGARSARETIRVARRLGIKTLTLYTFSTENWRRPKDEIDFLMHLLARHLRRERKNLIEQGICFKTIGDLKALPETVQKEVEKTVIATREGTGMTLIFALNYGARQEILSACKKLIAAGISSDALTEDVFKQYLETKAYHDPDLIIRTSGEVRLSNFLLWQSAYSELVFLDKAWPEFTESDFLHALADFSSRQRRFGRAETSFSKHERVANIEGHV